jgi:peptide/nickel transport system substrate-binding protein
VGLGIFNGWSRHLTYFNTQRPYMKDLLVRQALAYAINRNEISEKLYFGIAPPTRGPFLVGPDASVKPFERWSNPNATYPDYDPDMANKLLDQAGYLKNPTTGIRFQLKYIAFSFATVYGGPEMADMIREQLKKVGIDIKIEAQMPAIAADLIAKGDYDLLNWAGIWGPDASEWAVNLVTGSVWNGGHWSNSRADELVQMGRNTASYEDRKKIYGELQEILAKELPWLVEVEYPFVDMYNKHYHGFFWESDVAALTGHSQLRLVWWEGGGPLTTATSTATPTTAATGTTTPIPSAPVDTTLIASVAIIVIVIIAVAALALTRRKKTGD